ncbi:MAG: S8 family serine peptidase [Bacteroidota bacterium]
MDSKALFGKITLVFLAVQVFFLSFDANGQSKALKSQIKAHYDQEKIRSLIARFERENTINQQRMAQIANKKDWQMTEKALDGTVVALRDIGTDGTPLFYTTLMDPTSKVSRANTLYQDGLLGLQLDGKGMEVGVWDAGPARTTHQEFDTRAINADGSEAVSSHATLVTGTLISSGVKEKAKGVAYAARAVTHDWTRDKIEVAEAAANGLLLSNHSYGIATDRVPDWYFGSYIKVSQDWDDIMYNAPYYLMVAAAGNAQHSYDNESPNYGKTQDGFDLLLGFTTSKNGITVAGANTRIDNKGELRAASVATYSSFGPVDDGRVKPDLAGDGTAIFSTTSNTNASYASSTGTSMATPGVTGALLLLQEYHEELFGTFMRAATLKGLALHTADDIAAPGPDYKMGWGIINTKKAAEVLAQRDYSTLISEEHLLQGESYSVTVKAQKGEKLMASLSWTDPKGTYTNRGELNATTAALTNDLDIRITKDGKEYLPWKLNPAKADAKAKHGDNRVDPYERIEIDNAEGEYTITISHKGMLAHASQDFSLLVSGASLSLCTTDTPEEPVLVSASPTGVTVGWEALEETLFELAYREQESNTWQMATLWEDEMELSDLQLGKVYEVRLRTVCTENLASPFSETLQFRFDGSSTPAWSNNQPLSYQQELQLSVYPNPTTAQINIEASLSPDAMYSIVATSGNIVKKGKINGAIQVADMASGLYVLVVQDYSGKKMTKFYKN